MQDSVSMRQPSHRWYWLTALLAVVVAGGLWFSTLRATGNKAAEAEAAAKAMDWANEPGGPPVVVDLPQPQIETPRGKTKTPDKTP